MKSGSGHRVDTSTTLCQRLFLGLMQMRWVCTKGIEGCEGRLRLELDLPVCRIRRMMRICCFSWASKSWKVIFSLTLWFGALPLDPAGGSVPDPRYGLALPARNVCPSHIFDLPTPLVMRLSHNNTVRCSFPRDWSWSLRARGLKATAGQYMQYWPYFSSVTSFLRYVVYVKNNNYFCTSCSKTTQVETLYTWNVMVCCI